MCSWPAQACRQLLGAGLEALGVEVDVGDGGEECLGDEDIDSVLDLAELAGAMGVHADAFDGMEEEVL